jgi:hypothetical protein
MDLEETEAFNAIVMSHSVEALKAYVSSRFIVMRHSVEALKASVSSMSIVMSHSVEALKASVDRSLQCFN